MKLTWNGPQDSSVAAVTPFEPCSFVDGSGATNTANGISVSVTGEWRDESIARKTIVGIFVGTASSLIDDSGSRILSAHESKAARSRSNHL